MKAVTVGRVLAGSVCFEEVPEPDERTGSILVEAVAVGISAPTRRSPRASTVGRLPGGIGSSSVTSRWVGCSTRAPRAGRRRPDRRDDPAPDPVPCGNCAVGEWDMCRNGQYTERGIKEIDGFMSERWRIEPGFFTKLDPSLGILGVLLEPATVVAKAWELVAVMRARAFWEPRTVLVTGAGPIGMLAALVGVQHGFEVHVLDRVTEGAEPATRQGSRCDVPRRRGRRHRLRARCGDRVHGGRAGDRRRGRPGWRRGRRLSHRCGQRRTGQRAGVGRHGESAGASEQRHRRIRQRQPAALIAPPRRSPPPTGTGLPG